MASLAGAAVAVAVSIRVGSGVPPDLSAAAIRSCDTALGEGRCELESADAAPAEFYADVSGAGTELDVARVDLRRDADGVVLESRQVAFAPEDAPRERWASIGVLIAALVVARSREAEPPPRNPPAVAPPRRRARPAAPLERAEHHDGTVRLDLRSLISRRTGGNSPEIGGELGASFLFGGGPPFAGFSAAAGHRIHDAPALSWFSAAIGCGARLAPVAASFAAELRGAFVGEYWLFAASEPGRAERTGGFRVGGVLGIDALYAVQPRWILSLGIEGLFVEPRQRVEIEGRVVERISEFGALLLAGVRFVP